MKIGIGVCSYRRPELATKLCKEIIQTIDTNKHTIQKVCSVDDKDISGYEWIRENFGLIHGHNMGIPVNKNRLIKHLKNNDVLFIIEDDIGILKKGWVDLYLTAIQETGYQHMNYIVKGYRDFIDPNKIKKYKSVSLGWTGPYVSGVMMVISKHCLRSVGGIDERYKVYGYEHADYSRRCKMSNLYPQDHFHVMEATSYFEDRGQISCTPDEIKKKYIKENDKIWQEQSKLIFRPFMNAKYSVAKPIGK